MVHSAALHLQTEGEVQILDISDEFTREVREADVDEGLATAFVTGSTGAITTIEHEPGLVEEDMPKALERLFPRHGEGVKYGHERRWGDGNGHSHVRASFIGPSLTVPVADGSPRLGTWQQVVFVELDNKPRDREILVRVVGDG